MLYVIKLNDTVSHHKWIFYRDSYSKLNLFQWWDLTKKKIKINIFWKWTLEAATIINIFVFIWLSRNQGIFANWWCLLLQPWGRLNYIFQLMNLTHVFSCKGLILKKDWLLNICTTETLVDQFSHLEAMKTMLTGFSPILKCLTGLEKPTIQKPFIS